MIKSLNCHRLYGIKMNLAQLQIAFFYDVNTPCDFDGLSYFARKSIRNVLGVELLNNQMFGSVPREAPPEFPRLQLSNENNKIRMMSTLHRSDLFIEGELGKKNPDLDAFIKITDELYGIHRSLNKKIVRVGMIAYKTDFDDNPAITIAKKYFNLATIGGTDDLIDANIMFNKAFEIEGQKFNCHLSHICGLDNERQQPMLIRQVDVSSFENFIFDDAYTFANMKSAFLSKVSEY